jgi:hypothetical protein
MFYSYAVFNFSLRVSADTHLVQEVLALKPITTGITLVHAA